MATKTNSFESFAFGAPVTVAGSGSATATAFDTVSGGLVVQATAASTGTRGVVASLSSSAESAVGWNIPLGTNNHVRDYMRLSAVPPHNMRLILGYAGTVLQWAIRVLPAFNFDFITFAGGVGTQRAVVMNNAAAPFELEVTYRVEASLTATGMTLSIYAGDSTTAVSSATYAGGTIAAIDNPRFGIGNSANASSSRAMDGVGWSDTAALGPDPVGVTSPNLTVLASKGTAEYADTITWTATQTDGGTIASYAWRVLSGPALTLTGTGASRSATIPALFARTIVVIGVTATDTLGNVGTEASVPVAILPHTDWTASGGVLVPVRNSAAGL